VSSAKRSLHKEDLSKSPITIVLLRKKISSVFSATGTLHKKDYFQKKKRVQQGPVPLKTQKSRGRETHTSEVKVPRLSMVNHVLELNFPLSFFLVRFFFFL